MIVAEDEPGIVGFVAAGRCRGEDVDDSTGEVYSIYVDPERWGEGIGRRLLRAAEERLAELGYDRAILWVLHTNEPTRRFYERWGWRTDGTTKTDDIGGVGVTELRYVAEP